MRLVWITLISVALCIDSIGANAGPRNYDEKLTDADLHAVRQLAVKFTISFAGNRDLAPAIKDLYSKDFIERYMKGKAKVLGRLPASNLDFVPGLSYNSRLHTEASAEDWLRFYTAANNFMFFGIVTAIKNPPNFADVRPTALYPVSVIKLLDTNPNLANMIVQKERPNPISSVEEMHQATAILEQAVSLMRQQPEWQQPVKTDESELMKAMKEEAYFKPTARAIGDQIFDLPQGTQMIVINTPILYRLLIVKNNNKFEIFWAEPVRGR